jgi:MFS family permease
MYFGIVIATVPVLWLGVLQPWQACLVQFIAGLTWSGYNLGAFNLLLGCTPDEHRPRYVAIHTTTTALVASIGPIIGGWLIDLGGFTPTFALSSVVRALGLILFVAFVSESRQNKARQPVVQAAAAQPSAPDGTHAPGEPEVKASE